ncbi:hypothetical protein GCM10009610_01490 [Pseudonocardia xinjiangensis]
MSSRFQPASRSQSRAVAVTTTPIPRSDKTDTIDRVDLRSDRLTWGGDEARAPARRVAPNLSVGATDE